MELTGARQSRPVTLEAIGTPTVPVVVFPRVSAAHVRHPAWAGHLAALRAAGVHLLHEPGVWPVDEPRQGPPGGRPVPWPAILAAVDRLTA